MEEKRIPSLWLNILFSQVRDVMGRRSLMMLLRRTGLPQYIDNLPPLDDSPSVTVEDAPDARATDPDADTDTDWPAIPGSRTAIVPAEPVCTVSVEGSTTSVGAPQTAYT